MYSVCRVTGVGIMSRIILFRDPARCESEQEVNDPEGKKRTILGVGTAALDYIAYVSRYPLPDEKIKSNSVEESGGGNIANSLTCISRLGLCKSILLTKIGEDANGKSIVDELNQDMVDTTPVVLSGKSGFTYM